MAVNSKMLPLGSKACSFNLYDTISAKNISFDEMQSDKATVIMFICNHCPYVKYVLDGIINVAREYIAKGVSFIGISSNDVVKYPEDSPQEMKNLALVKKFPFAYLYDETQKVARDYDAACTPDFYVYDGNLKLAYHGQMDGARPGNDIPNDGTDLRNALENILHNRSVNEHQIPSVGCSIKWK